MVPSSPQLCFGKETMSVERQMGTSARMTRSVRLSSMRRKPTGLLGGTARCLRSSKLPHNISWPTLYRSNNAWRSASASTIGVRAMRCTACGAELILTNVVRIVPGVEHHTFSCSKCHVAGRRVVFTKHGREDASVPISMDAAPSTAHEEHIGASGLFGRLMARLRGRQFL